MGYELINPRDEDITGTVKKVDPTSSTATIIFQVLAGKIRTTDLALYHTKDLAGLSKDDIIAYFKGYDDIKDVSVSFYPFWVMRAPLLIDHISIVVSK